MQLNTAFTATITTSTLIAVGVPLASNHTWTFTTGYPRALPVNLGSPINYMILAKTGISSVPASVVTGSIAVSPEAATAITGFNLADPPTV
ncbi:MAG: hypothetical protein Q8N23_13315 [Archangium sp.]|nr:hypothetical protein [Archangium sp.]MDP3153651.1 hypothetical protein [Archangium sp.]MDP3569301.1 hypothetical protein [Archangium sp.]